MDTQPLRVLQLAPRFSANPTNGAELRIHHFALRLSQHLCTTHVGFVAPGAPTGAFPAGGPRSIAVPRYGSYRPLDLIKGFAGHVPFSVLNYTRGEMTTALQALLNEERFDIVQLESIHLAGYLPAIRGAANPPKAIVCDWHNIESEVLRRYADASRSLPHRVYARHAARKLEGFERRFIGECDLHIAVSNRDRDTLHKYSAGARVAVIENGVDTTQFADAAGGSAKQYRILFVGAMDYHANIEGATFFARDVWPRVRTAVPDAVFTIVGRNPSPDVRALAVGERVEVTGTVADVRPYYREALVAIVPLRVGGGTRLKILEAMAAGVPVVSTALGAEGLAAEPGTHFLLADNPEAITQAILELGRNPAQTERLIAAGRDLVRRQYDWAALGDELANQLIALVHY